MHTYIYTHTKANTYTVSYIFIYILTYIDEFYSKTVSVFHFLSQSVYTYRYTYLWYVCIQDLDAIYTCIYGFDIVAIVIVLVYRMYVCM